MATNFAMSKEEVLARALIQAYKLEIKTDSGFIIVVINSIGVRFLNWSNILFDNNVVCWQSLNNVLKNRFDIHNIIDYSSLNELEVKLALAGFPIE